MLHIGTAVEFHTAPAPSPKQLAYLDALAEKAGADHADRIVEIAATFPAEVGVQAEVFDLGIRTLDKAIDSVTAKLREHTATPESEIEHFAALAHAS